MSDRPWFVVRSGDVSEEVGAYPAPFDTEALAAGRDLGRAAGSRALGVSRDRLPPGRRTSFAHAHLFEEEVVYVLAGAPSLRWIPPCGPAEEVELSPGDLVVFPAGTGIGHCFVNRSAADAELLVVGERRPGDRVTYPEDPMFEAWREVNRLHRVWRDPNGPAGDATWPAVRIETPRLVLRPWDPSEAGLMIDARVRNRDHLLPWMTWAAVLPTPEQQAEQMATWSRELMGEGREALYGVFLHDGTLVGGTGIHDRVGPLGRELGYWVDLRHHRQGYVTEWVAALVQVAFAGLTVDRVEIRCDPLNTRSAAVPRRLGFTHEATLPRRLPGLDGQPRDTMVWSMYRASTPTSPIPTVPIRAFDRIGRRLV